MTVLRTLILLPLLVGCSQSSSTSSQYSLNFDASDDRGEALEGVVITVGKTRIGATGANGTLKAQVSASKGERFDLHLVCPASHQAGEAPTHIVFRDTKGLAGKRHSNMHLKIECNRRNRLAALLVSGGYPGMPVLIDGVEEGRTGADGFAHLALELAPGTPFEVAIDSSQHPLLRPVGPRRTMTLGSEDELFIFDPSFREAVPPKKKRRARRHKRAPEPEISKRPVRID